MKFIKINNNVINIKYIKELYISSTIDDNTIRITTDRCNYNIIYGDKETNYFEKINGNSCELCVSIKRWTHLRDELKRLCEWTEL